MTHPFSQLYFLDQALLRLDRKIAQTPRSLEEISLEESRQNADDQRRREELEELGKLIRKMDRDGDEIREKIRRNKSKLKQTQTAEVIQILQRETGNLESDLEALELQILENMETLENRERESQLRRSGTTEKRLELERERSNLNSEMEEYRVDRDRMAMQRERFLDELEPDLRRRYLHIFKGHGFSSTSALKGGACGGCGQRQTPQRAMDIQERGDLGVCQGCGRLLIGVDA